MEYAYSGFRTVASEQNCAPHPPPPPFNPNPNTNPTLSPNSNQGQFLGHYDAY